LGCLWLNKRSLNALEVGTGKQLFWESDRQGKFDGKQIWTKMINQIITEHSLTAHHTAYHNT